MALFSSGIKGKMYEMLFFILLIQCITSSNKPTVIIYEDHVEIHGHQFTYESDLIKDIALKKVSDLGNEEYLKCAIESYKHARNQVDNVYFFATNNNEKLGSIENVVFLLLNDDDSYVWLGSGNRGCYGRSLIYHDKAYDDGLIKADKESIMNSPLYYLKWSNEEKSTIDVGFIKYSYAYYGGGFQVQDTSYNKFGQRTENQSEIRSEEDVEKLPTVSDAKWMYREGTDQDRYPAKEKEKTEYFGHITVGDAITLSNIIKEKANSKTINISDIIINVKN